MFGRSRSNHQILFRLAPINLHLGLHGSGSAYSLSGFNVQVRLLFRALALGLVAVDGFLALVALAALVGIWFGRTSGVST
jgi:hypothetical protein